MWFPTPMQKVGEVHDTADSIVAGCPLGIDQVVPFHVSDRAGSANPVKIDPTATHEMAVEQEIPVRKLPGSAMVGVVCTDHVVPFHASASVCALPPNDSDPTATHVDVVGHVT